MMKIFYFFFTFVLLQYNVVSYLNKQFIKKKLPNFNSLSNDDLEIDDYYLSEKPWRAPKVKYLTYNYLTFKDNWKERFYTSEDFKDNIYLYNQPIFRPQWDRTRLDEYWLFPWLWSKNKVERLCWLQKHFDTNIDSMTIQEHMEFEALFSEIDMPQRWVNFRYKELEVIFLLVFNIAFFTDFNGIRPTDLGLRPDGTLRACPVQFHNCISSSNNPLDTDHYAPPFKWERGKSPEQAFDEIKNIYLNYPKRGLRWSYGWIDRGGWKPQQFSGKYFHAEADELIFKFTDDVEFLLIPSKREVQYRSSPRLYQDNDFDTGRLRYNQFVRMLISKGGWDIKPMNKLEWLLSTPYRLVDQLLDKSYHKIITISNNYDLSNNFIYQNSIKLLNNQMKELILIYNQIFQIILPYVQPIITNINDFYDNFKYDPKIINILNILKEFRDIITNSINNDINIKDDIINEYIQKYFYYYLLLPPTQINFRLFSN